MALGYSYSGYTKLVSPSWLDGTALARVLENPLARGNFLGDIMLSMPGAFLQLATWGALAMELLFAPLSLVSRLRPWVWLSMLLLHFSLIALIDFADLSLGMVMLHGFTFNPAWLGALRKPEPEMLFYDGDCGLCQHTVRFVLAEDPAGDLFHFAPLQSEAFLRAVPAARRKGLPDSVVVLTSSGTLFTRSRAIWYILNCLGGLWRILGFLGGLLPTRLCDTIYDGIARVRHHLFRPPPSACPLVPEPLRRRFHH